MRVRFIAGVVILLAATAAFSQVTRGGALPGPLPLFPRSNWWNTDISRAPVDSNSSNFITFIGSANVLGWLAVILAAWLWRSRGRHIAAVLVTAPAVATALFVWIKNLFQRIRPAGAVPLHLVSYSLPSGHATASTAVLVTVSYIMARERLLSHSAALILGFLGPLLVGLSRIYLDVHWTTDVLGGWGLGLVVAALSAAAYEHMRARISGASA